MKKLIAVALAAGSLLVAGSSQAWAWDGWYGCRDGRYGDRGYGRPHHRGSIVVVYQTRRPSHDSRTVEVIPAPVSDTVVINIPNENGSYTPVTLRRVGGVYVGPRGEQYLNLPTVDQLKPVYGLK